MNKQIRIAAVLAAAITTLLTSGCNKFDQINTNPDKPVKVTPDMLATTLILDATKATFRSNTDFVRPAQLGKYTCWSSSPSTEQYNYFGRTDFLSLPVLNNIKPMVDLATTDPLKNAYSGLGKCMRALKFFYLTMQLGDIPYTQALSGEEGTLKPEYDTQKDVFLGLLKELDEANDLFANASDFPGDPVYGGKVTQWRKFANSLQLQILMNLYKKTADADLKVVTRFQDIINNRPIFQSNADNFGLVFSNVAGQKYPFYIEGNQSYVYVMVSSFLIDSLKAFNDNRLFYYANPSPVKVAAGKAVSDPAAYSGPDPAAPYSDITKVASSKDYSPINDRYLQLPQGEPVYMLSYAQLKFIMAEAGIRGWIPGGGEAHYTDGIKAAMHCVADNTPDDPLYHHNQKITDTYIQNTYLQQAKVKFATSTDDKLRQVWIQQYLSLFLQAPYSAYYEYRRTGYPVFTINPASNLNTPTNKIPQRYLYPQSELDYNKEHVVEAIQRQYNGDDNVNNPMWILQD
ncbi:hypothetical protein A4H97_21510 [Niastella yeongjuensis]|uniref:SusD/RagB family nutrient-binding outer membrane lipoprotein n=1 Tax=Niastella yeongjuensis TaxID=354355 RepID=A0A1V9F807_9BACT|nr:SusD/RagB family nutrient-binding outer membrane lipoprotein [Niastella yeongjuensis]OQP54550.1 hypothetical protein A4H97_21510 [Niastella yeongjuensis]SEN98665.1 Starch-binding associating with outer membrane [Niastella yeongjuensis]